MCSLLPFQEKCDECCFLICFILQTSSNHILLNISLPAEKKRNPVGTALSRRTRMLLFSSLTPQAKRESLPFSKQLPRPFLLDLYLHAFKDIRQSVSLFNLPARSQLYMFFSVSWARFLTGEVKTVPLHFLREKENMEKSVLLIAPVSIQEVKLVLLATVSSWPIAFLQCSFRCYVRKGQLMILLFLPAIMFAGGKEQEMLDTERPSIIYSI